jgi:hypothetical protein
MNPLNPWVALTEILILLALAFGAGYRVGRWQYRDSIRGLDERIRQARQELKRLQA